MTDTPGEKGKKSTVAQQEEETLLQWNHAHIFEKTLEQTKDGEHFTFYDGPPFATGLPHYGHLLAGAIKDAVPRYQTMRGKQVRRVWGWDCHGLPVENLIEKELGLKHKKDIEEYGIDKFNQAAFESVLRYDTEWSRVVPRFGRWIDMDRSYKTMDWKYTESVWWAFKTLYDKGLIYEGYKPMHICPRCETTLSNSEVGQGYKDITDLSVTAKFELVDEPGTYVLAWTTTPWTLPGNVALAVGEKIKYQKVKVKNESGDELVIVAAERIADVLKGKEHEVIEELLGNDLVGKAYKPLFGYYADDINLLNRENGWKIYAADFVTTEDGTGVVHIAPAFGEDDMNVGKKYNLPFVQHISMDGTFKSEVKDFAGMEAKPKSDDEKTRLGTDIAILKYLQEKGSYFDKQKVTHSYPHCYRCDTPLLNYAASSWFVNVTTLKEKMLEQNATTSWIPESMKEGRFGKWLEGARDWSISRSRFWGAPLPVWRCASCKKDHVIGSVAEVSKPARNTYLVMRHGESENNAKNIVSAKFDNPHHLTEKGKIQAHEAAQKLKGQSIDFIVSSDFMRTKETAEIVLAELGLSSDALVFDERLREINTGVCDGKDIAEYHKIFATPFEKFSKAPEGGETLDQVRARVMDALHDFEKKYEGKKILIVTHEYLAWMLWMGATGALSHEAIDEKTRRDEEFLRNAQVMGLPFMKQPHNTEHGIDLHRPYIDEVVLPCTCGEEMKRIPDVFDCWFESGSMPYAQFHYPFENKDVFEKNFPADFIAEGQDQTRGWFYNLMVLAVGLFEKTPFEQVIVNGLILAEDGQKMSKRLKNYPEVDAVFDRYGADALRYFLLSSPAVHAEDLNFSERGVDEVLKKVILRTDNVLAFYALYRDDAVAASDTSTNVLDLWIVARLGEVAGEMTKAFDAYELDRATRPIGLFVDDLSTWYVRRSRDRFKADDRDDVRNAKATLRFVLLEFSKLIAPVMPFLAERMYAMAGGEKESVHLERWATGTTADANILEEMATVRAMVSQALEERAKAGIKVRQPLASLTTKTSVSEELAEVIKDEVNVKEVMVRAETDGIILDTVITPELKREGQYRDLLRAVQEARKKAGLKPGEEMMLTLDLPAEWKDVAKEKESELMRTTFADAIQCSELSDVEPTKIEDAEIKVLVVKK
ncbi:MAG: hypothetical protein A2408_02055 [Candidatus Yonathbacteria bacterium RIFOXYC1_FULL_52_10]|nr:MAG: hypothetical protein A2408_02055 [Candidatus Yonathbacteria bacterium RIFOXYC1_FULL_52_10]